MITNTHPQSSQRPWEIVSKVAYWDRDVPLEKWREKVQLGDSAYLSMAVRKIAAQDFIRFLGKQDFVNSWPLMRKHLSEQDLRFSGKLDLMWSWLRSGTFNFKPQVALSSLPGRRAEVYEAIARQPGQSIYGLAKGIDAPYRRVHDHVKALMQDGLVYGQMRERNGRRQHILSPY